MANESFEQWCIVEIMGHQKFAGRVTEQVIGGSSFLRVDVPAVGDKQAFTKMFGANSIYCITPVDEETALAAAGSFRQQPIEEWSARQMLGVEQKPFGLADDSDDNDDDQIPY